MKKIIIPILALFVFTALAADKVVETTTVKTVTSTGTLEQYLPGKTFIVKETTGPVEYRYAPQVVYTTRTGKLLTDAEVQRRFRTGIPVWVHYTTDEGKRIVTKVEIDD